MPYYPINLNLRNRKCVVIGGGTVAERKVKTLLEFGATVVVVSPELSSGLQEMLSRKQITHIASQYEPRCLREALLVIAATDDRQINQTVALEADSHNILVNIVDDPELCTFFVPAIVRRGDVVISVSTSGKSPALARRIREQVESYFGPEYALLADLLGELRDEVKGRYSDSNERHQAFVRVLDSDVLELLAQGQVAEAKGKARQCLQG